MKTYAQFTKAQAEALLSMDEQKIRAFQREFNGKEMPTDPLLFWGIVHKVITGLRNLPLEFRKKSKAYLDAHNLQSYDDGEL